MNAEEILEKVKSVYEQFDSYSDSGTVETPGSPGPPLEFQTFFKRPLKFRFQWLERFPESTAPGTDCGGAIWTDGTSFNGRIQDTIKRSESLSSILAEAASHVPGSIDFILGLLLPESFEGLDGQQEISEPRNLPDENVNGIECFHVGATGEEFGELKMCIEKSTFLVRRVNLTWAMPEEFTASIKQHMRTVSGLDAKISTIKPELSFDDFLDKVLPTAGEVCIVWNYSKVTVNAPIEEALFSP